MELVGVGTDLVDVERFRRVVSRTPRLVTRVFTAAELADARRRRDPTEPLAARFAAKEAAMKALGVGIGAVAMRDLEVVREVSGRPRLVLHGTAARRAQDAGVTDLLVTMSHTATAAVATVLAVGAGTDRAGVDRAGTERRP